MDSSNLKESIFSIFFDIIFHLRNIFLDLSFYLKKKNTKNTNRCLLDIIFPNRNRPMKRKFFLLLF